MERAGPPRMTHQQSQLGQQAPVGPRVSVQPSSTERFCR